MAATPRILTSGMQTITTEMCKRALAKIAIAILVVILAVVALAFGTLLDLYIFQHTVR